MASDNFLFAYGSLITGTGVAAVDKIIAGAEVVGRGYIHGRLFDLGAYPGAILSKLPADKVFGSVHRIEARAWPQLDAFEGFDENAPAHSEFLRRKARVRGLDGRPSLQAWVYVYNERTHNAERILTGDYLEFLKMRREA